MGMGSAVAAAGVKREQGCPKLLEKPWEKGSSSMLEEGQGTSGRSRNWGRLGWGRSWHLWYLCLRVCGVLGVQPDPVSPQTGQGSPSWGPHGWNKVCPTTDGRVMGKAAQGASGSGKGMTDLSSALVFPCRGEFRSTRHNNLLAHGHVGHSFGVLRDQR